MARRHKHHNSKQYQSQDKQSDLSNAWVLSSKRPGDVIGGWIISETFEQSKRQLETGERCKLTSFCYPTGARLVKAKLEKRDAIEESKTAIKH